MKKFRILALVMTCAILLSSIMIVPVAAASNSVSIDGISNEDIWANPTTNTYNLNFHVDSANYSPGSTKYPDNFAVINNTSSFVKVACDADYLYVYHETTDLPYVTSKEWGSKKAGFYFTVSPTGGSYSNTSNTADGLNIGIFVRSNYNVLNALITENNTTTNVDGSTTYTFTWDGSNGGTIDGSTQLVDFIRYCHTVTTGYATDSATYKGTKVALVMTLDSEGEGVKQTIEMRIPLADSYKNALQTVDGAAMQVQLFERSRIKVDGTSSSSSGDAGYMYSADGTNNTRSFVYSGNFASAGFSLTLPSKNILADGSKTAPVLVGFQSKDNKNGTYDVRFVAVVDDYTGFDLTASKLGFVFNNGSVDDTRYCKTVYETLNAGDGKINASDFGGKYFFCFSIKGMDASATYNLNVKCFTKATAEADAEFCANPVDVKITFADGKAVFTY